MKKLFRRLVSALLLISAFAPSIQADQYVNLFGDFNSWGKNELQCPDSQTEFNWTDVKLGFGKFLIKIWDGSNDTYYKSNGNKVPTDGTPYVTKANDGSDLELVSATSSDVFDVYFNKSTKTLKVTKKGGGGDDPDPVIDVPSKLYMIGGFNSWNGEGIEGVKSGDSFTFTNVHIPSDNCQFRFATQSSNDNGVHYGRVGGQGALEADGTPFQEGKESFLLNKGTYTITVDFSTKKVSYTGGEETTSPDVLYIIGNFDGCNWTSGRGVQGEKEGNVFTFRNITFLDDNTGENKFRFATVNNNDQGTHYGRKAGTGQLSSGAGDEFYQHSGTPSGTNSFTLPKNTYDITINFDTKRVTYAVVDDDGIPTNLFIMGDGVTPDWSTNRPKATRNGNVFTFEGITFETSGSGKCCFGLHSSATGWTGKRYGTTLDQNYGPVKLNEATPFQRVTQDDRNMSPVDAAGNVAPGTYNVIVDFDNMTITLTTSAVQTLYLVGSTVGKTPRAVTGTRDLDNPNIFTFKHIYTDNGTFMFHTRWASSMVDYEYFYGNATDQEEQTISVNQAYPLVNLGEVNARRAFKLDVEGHYDFIVDMDPENMTVKVVPSEAPVIPNNLYIIGHVNNQKARQFDFTATTAANRQTRRENRDGTVNPQGKVFVFENIATRDNDNSGESKFTFRDYTSNGLQWTAKNPSSINSANLGVDETLVASSSNPDAYNDVTHFRITNTQTRKGSWTLPAGRVYTMKVDFTDFNEADGTGVKLYIEETPQLPEDLYLIVGQSVIKMDKYDDPNYRQFYVVGRRMAPNTRVGISLDNGMNPDFGPENPDNIVLEDDGTFSAEAYRDEANFWKLSEVTEASNYDIFVTFKYISSDPDDAASTGYYDVYTPDFTVIERNINESLIPEEVYLVGHLRDWTWDKKDIDPTTVPKFTYDARNRSFSVTANLEEPHFRLYTSADANVESHEYGLVADSKNLQMQLSTANNRREYKVNEATATTREYNWMVPDAGYGKYYTFTLSYEDPEHPVLSIVKEPDFYSYYLAGDVVTYESTPGDKSTETWYAGHKDLQFVKSDLPDDEEFSWYNGWYMLKLPILHGQFKINKHAGDNWAISFSHSAEMKDGNLKDAEDYFSQPVEVGEMFTAIKTNKQSDNDKYYNANFHLAKNVLENVTIYFRPDINGEDHEDGNFNQPAIYITAEKAYDTYFIYHSEQLLTEENILKILNDDSVEASDFVKIVLTQTDDEGNAYAMPDNRFYRSVQTNDEIKFDLVCLTDDSEMAARAREDETLIENGITASAQNMANRYVLMAKIPSGLEKAAGVVYTIAAKNGEMGNFLTAGQQNKLYIPETDNIYLLPGLVNVYLRQDYGTDGMNALHANDEVEISYRLISPVTKTVNNRPIVKYQVVSTRANNMDLFAEADAWGFMKLNSFHKRGVNDGLGNVTGAQHNIAHPDGHAVATKINDNIYHGHYPNAANTEMQEYERNAPNNLAQFNNSYSNAYVQFRIVRHIKNWSDVDWRNEYSDKLYRRESHTHTDAGNTPHTFYYYVPDPVNGNYLIDFYPAAEAASTASTPANAPARIQTINGVKIPEWNETVDATNDPTFKYNENYRLQSAPMYATVDTAKESITVGIEDIDDEFSSDFVEFDGEPVYFTIEGIRVAEPSAPGIYIVVRGSKSEKIVVE